ncbi:hypothetical protein G3A39_42760 [Paraburkholderia aspalathi]|nr:hypothetical protein [Paraburkholderia aspalathi]
MALTNAEKQARYRERQNAKLAAAQASPAVFVEQLQAKLDQENKDNGTACTLEDFAFYNADTEIAESYFSDDQQRTLGTAREYQRELILAMLTPVDP